MIDINDFKKLKDNRGYLYGDKYLKEISLILKEHFHKTTQIYHFGGDEFWVLQEVGNKNNLVLYYK